MVIKFNLKAWPKSYIDMNSELSENAKNYFEKYFVNLNHKELILKSKQSFRSEIVFTEGFKEIAGSANDDKRIQSIDSIKTYAYRTSKDLVFKKEKIKDIMNAYLCYCHTLLYTMTLSRLFYLFWNYRCVLLMDVL